MRAGEIIRIRTTGGGGWGDPLDRPYPDVERDVLCGKVSREAAAADYGVVLHPGSPSVDEPASDELRARLRAARPDREPFFDRGPGFARLSGGQPSSPFDWLP